MHAPLLDPSGWDDNCRRIVDSGGEWILGVLFPPFSFENRLFVKTGSGQTYGSLKTIGGFSQCRPAMGSVIAIVLAKLMGEKKEGRCTVSNLNLTLVGCTVSVIACELHTASNYIAPRVSGFIDRKSLLRSTAYTSMH